MGCLPVSFLTPCLFFFLILTLWCLLLHFWIQHTAALRSCVFPVAGLSSGHGKAGALTCLASLPLLLSRPCTLNLLLYKCCLKELPASATSHPTVPWDSNVSVQGSHISVWRWQGTGLVPSRRRSTQGFIRSGLRDSNISQDSLHQNQASLELV